MTNHAHVALVQFKVDINDGVGIDRIGQSVLIPNSTKARQAWLWPECKVSRIRPKMNFWLSAAFEAMCEKRNGISRNCAKVTSMTRRPTWSSSLLWRTFLAIKARWSETHRTVLSYIQDKHWWWAIPHAWRILTQTNMPLNEYWLAIESPWYIHQ